MNFYEKFTIQLLFVNWIRAIALRSDLQSIFPFLRALQFSFPMLFCAIFRRRSPYH